MINLLSTLSSLLSIDLECTLSALGSAADDLTSLKRNGTAIAGIISCQSRLHTRFLKTCQLHCFARLIVFIAPPMAGCKLEELASELQTMIFCLVPSVTNLHNLVTALLVLLQVYLGAKARILPDVIRNDLTKDDLKDACATIYAGHLELRGPVFGMIQGFMEGWSDGWPTRNNEERLSIDLSMPHSRLLTSTDYLIIAFTTETLDCIDYFADRLHSYDGPTGETDRRFLRALISTIERARQRRAFFHLHAYGQLFFVCSETKHQWHAADDYFAFASIEQLFHDYLLLWEVGELACVCEYCRQASHQSLRESGGPCLVTEACRSQINRGPPAESPIDTPARRRSVDQPKRIFCHAS